MTAAALDHRTPEQLDHALLVAAAASGSDLDGRQT